MAYDVRLFKLVTGEIVIGKYDEKSDTVNDVATLQSVPMQQGGVQMLILPYGYPFENTFCGSIESKNFIYRYKDTPVELQDKYLETATNLTVSGGMGKLQFGANPNADASKIIK